MNPHTFRVMGPDETASNRLQAVFEATDRTWSAGIIPGDDQLAPDGRVMEVLSEHLCQGWLEGYLLSGRHGLFVFTGGIGEGAAPVRAAIVRRLGNLGIAPISARRRRGDVVLSEPRVKPAVLRVEAREDLVIARAVVALTPCRGRASAVSRSTPT